MGQRVEPVKLPPAQAKMRTNMLATHTRKFVEVIKAYQAAQHHYKKEIKAKVKRQIHIVKPDATDGTCSLRAVTHG
jgi:syntaxin 1B/2/3